MRPQRFSCWALLAGITAFGSIQAAPVPPAAGDVKSVRISEDAYLATVNRQGMLFLAKSGNWILYRRDVATRVHRRADGIIERKRDRWALAALLQRAGIAAAPVENLRDMIETDPQMRHHYQRIRQPSDPDFEITIDGEPIRLAGQDRVLERAPTLGEHNEYVLREILGLSQQEFDALVVDGVVA